MKTIVVGIGNPILSDDSVGIHVVKKLRKLFVNPNVVIVEAATGGMNLLDMIIGYDKAILIDSLKSQNNRIGDVKRFSLQDFTVLEPTNPHDISLSAAVESAKRMGQNGIPQEIIVIGIIVKDPISFGEELTPKIAKAVPRAIEMTLLELKKES